MDQVIVITGTTGLEQCINKVLPVVGGSIPAQVNQISTSIGGGELNTLGIKEVMLDISHIQGFSDGLEYIALHPKGPFESGYLRSQHQSNRRMWHHH